jgi:DNA-directed RNA polymerase specialized sigma24 family protein
MLPLSFDVLPSVRSGRSSLAWIGRLPALSDRERLYLYLQGLGYRYSEMAKLTSASVRTVERQVLPARSKLGNPRQRG